MSNVPTHIVYHVKDIGAAGETDASRAIWTRVGAAWQHTDTKGFSIVLEAIPLTGRLVVRTAPQDDRQGEAQQDAEAASP